MPTADCPKPHDSPGGSKSPEGNHVTQTANQADYGVIQNGKTDDSSKSNSSSKKSVRFDGDPEVDDGQTTWRHEENTVRNDGEIVNLSAESQTVDVNGEEEEGGNEGESGSEEDEEEGKEAEKEKDKMDTRSPSPRAHSSAQDSLDLHQAARAVHDMHENILGLFGRVKTILGEYHAEVSSKTLYEFALEREDFQSNLQAVTSIYTECEHVTSSMNKQLKELRQMTSDIYRVLNRKFREEDLATWLNDKPDEKEEDRLFEERAAQEKATLSKAAEARLSFAKASAGISETHEIIAQVEAEAADAEVTARKARAVAEDAVRIAEDAKRAAEEKRKVEDEARKKAQERARVKAEEERKRREEEEKRFQEEAKKKGTSVDEVRQKEMDERAAREAERKNPKNWPRYIYSVEGGDFNPGVGCIIRAIDGSLSRDDVSVKRIDQLEGVLTLYENEELISNIIHVQPVDKEKTFSFEEPLCISLPHCAPRSGLGREPVVKMLQPSGRWSDLPTHDVYFEDIKELRFVEARAKRMGTYAVIYRIKKDKLTLLKRGGKVTSSVDSRVTFTSKPLPFNTDFTVEVQSVEQSMIPDLRQRKPECQGLLACSPILKTGFMVRKLPKALTVTLPVPPNPQKLKRPSTSVTREPAEGKTTEARPATAKASTTFTKSEVETPVDNVHLFHRLSDGTWAKIPDVHLIQAKNKDIVTFEIRYAYERMFILRTKLDICDAKLEHMATTINEAITQRTIQFYLRQHNDNLNTVLLSCTTVQRLSRNLQKLEEDGYEEGPSPSKATFVKEGQIFDLKFRGNLYPETEEYRRQFVFNSHIPCKVDFTVQTVDVFAQKTIDSYRGFAQLFTQGLVPRTLPPADDSREMRGTQQKAQPRVVMEVGEVIVTELLITVPKPEPEPPKPLVTAPLARSPEGPVNKDVLLHISQELGDEWKRLAQYLNVNRTRIQAILRQNVTSGNNTQRKHDMLLTWSKRLPRAADRVEILSHALMSCGRGDLAQELRDRKDEFRRQRSASARDSYLRKAFVKIARDPSVIVNWKGLGRKLGLNEADMADIDGERITSQEKCYHSLQRWQEKTGDEADIATLSKKLRYCRFKELAREVESIG